jgi:hypothetical protein
MSCTQSGGHPEGRTVNITCTGPVGKRVERSSRDTSGEDGECNERELHFAKRYRNWGSDEASVDDKEEKTSSS